MIHAVLAKQAGRHESSCTINVMCTKAQRKRIRAYVHKGREDKDQIYAHEGREDKDQAYVHKDEEDKDQAYVQNCQKGEGANLFARRNKGQRPSLIMGRMPQSKHMTCHTKIPINLVTEIYNVTLSQQHLAPISSRVYKPFPYSLPLANLNR